MIDETFQIPPLFDYVATFFWAASGAVVGIQKRFDVVGVFVMALVSSMGGGLLRDAVLLSRIPVMLTNEVYLPLIAATAVLASLLTGGFKRFLTGDTAGKLVALIDAVGIPAFAVIGMQLALKQGIPIPGVVLVGVANGVGGGLLRDVLVRDVPALLRPGQFVTLLLLFACVLFLWVTREMGRNPVQAALATVGVFFFLRVLTVRFNWQTRSGWRDAEATDHDHPQPEKAGKSVGKE